MSYIDNGGINPSDLDTFLSQVLNCPRASNNDGDNLIIPEFATVGLKCGDVSSKGERGLLEESVDVGDGGAEVVGLHGVGVDDLDDMRRVEFFKLCDSGD